MGKKSELEKVDSMMDGIKLIKDYQTSENVKSFLKGIQERSDSMRGHHWETQKGMQGWERHGK